MKRTTADQRLDLLKAAARNLREWGYPKATHANIMLVPVYRAFFDGMLRETLDNGRTPLAGKRLVESIRSEIAALETAEAATAAQKKAVSNALGRAAKKAAQRVTRGRHRK